MQKRQMRTVAAWVVVLTAAWSAAAANFYVRTSGNDSNAGTSPALAFRTVQRALQAAQAGDVIYVGRGTYSGAVSTVRAGTTAGRIRLVGDHTGAHTGDSGVPVLTASSGAVISITHDNIDIERFSITSGTTGVLSSGANTSLRSVTVSAAAAALVQVSGGTLTIMSSTLRDGHDDGLVVTGSGGATLSSSTVRGNTGSGVLVNGASAVAVIDRNTFLSNATLAAEATSGSLTFTNNLVRLGGSGLRINGGTVSAWHNTFVSSGSAGLHMTGGSVTARNNIFHGLTTGMQVAGGSLTHSNNLYWSNANDRVGAAAGAGDVSADPRFVNSASDWRLQNTSPAIDAGAGASGVTVVDRNGATRPRGPGFDIGAYEIIGASAATPYANDFEGSSTLGAEWSVTATATSTGTTRFVGPFGTGQAGLRVNTTPGTEYVLIFDAYLFNTWDGDNTTWGPDYFGVTVNGDIEFRATYNRPSGVGNGGFGWPDLPERYRADVYGGNGNDGLFRRVVVPFTPETAVSFITFWGENLQGMNDEGWGIDNVRVLRRSDAAALEPRFVAARLRGFDQITAAGEGGGLFIADLNADGIPDAVQGGGSSSRITLGDSTGFIGAAAATNMVRQAALGDFNNDGVPDLWAIAANNTETWMTGDGRGGFAVAGSGVTRPTGNDGLAAADLNADGRLDAALFSANGNWALLAGEADASARGIGSAVAISRSEVQAARAAAASSVWTLSNAVFPTGPLDAGDGDFVSSGDVNDDGRPDFFYHFGGGRLFLSRGDGTYESASRGIRVTTSAGEKIGSAMGDFDNDGDLDIFVTRRSGGACTLWVNPGQTGNFSEQAAARGVALTTGASGCAWGDYDNDGDLDLAVMPVTGTAVIYRNAGAPGYTFTADTLQGVSIEAVTGDVVFADVNNDGQLDLATGTDNASYPTRLFMNQGADDRFLKVRVLGRGPGGINTLGVGTRLELWTGDNTRFLQRRDIGAAKGFGGQEPLWAHFGGVDPRATYTLRVVSPSRTYAARVTPGSATTIIGSTTIPRMYTFDESQFRSGVRIVRWREQGPDEQ